MFWYMRAMEDIGNFDQDFDRTSGLSRAFLTLKRAFSLTINQFRSGLAKNCPYKRVDLTSVDHTSGRHCTTQQYGYIRYSWYLCENFLSLNECDTCGFATCFMDRHSRLPAAVLLQHMGF